MKTFDLRNMHNPPLGDGGLKALLQRPAFDASSLIQRVQAVLQDVQQNGDAAVKKYTADFDGVHVDVLQVSQQEINEAAGLLSDELKLAIQTAANNIRTFHSKQTTAPEIIETMPGIQCWRKSIGIEKVGIYIPGGSAPLFQQY